MIRRVARSAKTRTARSGRKRSWHHPPRLRRAGAPRVAGVPWFLSMTTKGSSSLNSSADCLCGLRLVVGPRSAKRFDVDVNLVDLTVKHKQNGVLGFEDSQ